MNFIELGLSPSIIKTLNKHNFTKAYPIQGQVIPAVMNGKDVLGIAKTGSGKTASYVLPILMNLYGNPINKNRFVNVLVLVPTRELAVQVQEVFHEFGSVLPEPIRSKAVFGGVSINPQMKTLSNVNVLVATPGRLLDLVDSNAVHLSEIETLVLDEADKMLSLGFEEEMANIFALLPKKRQNLLFSATFDDKLKDVNSNLLNNPVIINLQKNEGDDTQKKGSLDHIEQLAYYVSEENKGPLLRQIIKENKESRIMIFVSSTRKADNVAKKLMNNGIKATAIHSKKSQGKRTHALNEFKLNQLKVLITTDLLGRGIDITDIKLINDFFNTTVNSSMKSKRQTVATLVYVIDNVVNVVGFKYGNVQNGAENFGVHVVYAVYLYDRRTYKMPGCWNVLIDGF